MKLLQSFLNRVYPPVSFTADMSAPEVRITLRQMCGSSWDGYCFDGTVGENSFTMVKNCSNGTRGAVRVAVDGDFSENDGKTHISARPRIRPADIPSVLIAVLIGLLLTVFGTFDLLLSFIMGELWTVFSSLILIALGAALLIFEHALILVSYKKTVKAIKKELGVTESDAVSMK